MVHANIEVLLAAQGHLIKGQIESLKTVNIKLGRNFDMENIAPL